MAWRQGGRERKEGTAVRVKTILVTAALALAGTGDHVEATAGAGIEAPSSRLPRSDEVPNTTDASSVSPPSTLGEPRP